jgi:hypothetical protein
MAAPALSAIHPKCLSYLFACRSGLDCAAGVYANAAVAACRDSDGEGDELAGLGIEMGGLTTPLVERDETGDGMWR